MTRRDATTEQPPGSRGAARPTRQPTRGVLRRRRRRTRARRARARRRSRDAEAPPAGRAAAAADGARTRPRSTSSSPSARRPTSRTTASGWRARTRRPPTRGAAQARQGAAARARPPRARAQGGRAATQDVIKGFAMVRDELLAALGERRHPGVLAAGRAVRPDRARGDGPAARPRTPSPGTVLEVYQQGYRAQRRGAAAGARRRRAVGS